MNHCLNLHVLILVFFACSGRLAQGQNAAEKLKFSRLEIGSGLSNSNVTSFLQDSRGFMWIGTRDGLNKYDGYEFKVYRNDQEDTTTLLKNHIYQLFEDSRGTIWVSTRGGGFHFYDQKHDRFVRVKEFSSYCVIAHITEDKDRNVWISGIHKEQAFTARLDYSSQQWQYYHIFPSLEPVTFLSQDSGDEFLIGVRRTGFYKWNRKTNTVKPFLPEVGNPESIMSRSFLRAARDQQNNLWITTAIGLCKFDPRTEKFTNFSTEVYRDFPGLAAIVELCVDKHFVWLGTENGGLLRFDSRKNSFTSFLPDKNDIESISDLSIWSVYKDREGRIWIGTFSRGLCILDAMKEKFSELNIPLENEIVNAIHKDYKNRLWIGTEGGLVMKDGDVIKYFRHDAAKPASLSNDPVLSIYEDSHHQMWFGTWTGGLERFNEKNGNFNHFQAIESDPTTIASPNVFSITEWSKTGQLLVTSFRGLNVMIDAEKGIFERHVDARHASNNTLSVVYEDHEGNIWTGSNAELNLYNIKTRQRTRYYVGSLNDSTTVGGYVNCILEDSKNRLWVGASNGLHLIRNKKWVERFTTKNGLPNNIVRGILEDSKGRLWLSTTQGLSQFDPATGRFQNYDMSDGLPGNEFKANACFKNSDGQLFFGGKGIVAFYPDSLKRNPHVPTVVITDLKLFNESVEIGGDDKILSEQASESREISLDHQYNFFTLNFVALNFTATSKNKYAYKLEGFNNNWTQAGDQRSATFTNLDPGTYTFQVIASNNDGLWNEHGAKLIIHILPPWWKTWWFRVLTGLMVATAAMAFYRIRVRRIKELNRKLEHLVSVRTKELKAQEEEIKDQNMQLVQQRHELVTQNEELIGSQEEISAQRDLVALQNQELQNARAIIIDQNEKIKARNEDLEKEVEKRTRELIEYTQQLEQFAFISAHNLRAPVARILGLGQILDLSDKDVADNKFITDRIVSTTRELDRVVRDLNTILEIRKDPRANITDTVIDDELRIVKASLEKEIVDSGVTIKSDFSKVEKIQTVKPYLNSILMNLVSNAIKYRNPERQAMIDLRSDVEGEFVCITVKDNGLGIDLAAFREKLFVLYSRFHTHIEGKGMGLYLVKTQVNSLGGKIVVDSEINEGTTFKVYLKPN
jgi:ligand-binding sensor domain-containing protein/signal transduction histidine kinase